MDGVRQESRSKKSISRIKYIEVEMQNIYEELTEEVVTLSKFLELNAKMRFLVKVFRKLISEEVRER